MPQSLNSEVAAELAPKGVLRASINLGNPLLAHRRGDGGVGGVSVDLAHRLGERLGVPVELLVLDSAGASVATVSSEKADVGFFALDPLRAQGILFSPAYLLIEGAYMVREDSPVANLSDVDQPGNRVMVGAGSAYDLFLTCNLKQAQILRAPTSPAVTETFLAQAVEVAAGVRQQLMADRAGRSGLRVLDESFMTIAQAMGIPLSRSRQAHEALIRLLQDSIASGFVHAALQRHGIDGATVAAVEGSPLSE